MDEDNRCNSTHELIMYELTQIKKQMSEDMKKIDASYSDLEVRNRIWNFIKFVGFGTSAGAVYKLLEWIMNT